ncbi:MAG: Hsp20/alpha crystallin family protein [Ectothiorhodospiraceae bacterium]|jgi:HSP20 family molecular chaperone IbpA
MRDTQNVAMQQGGQSGEHAAETAATLVPAVDIYEDNDGIRLVADMPGVTREALSLEVRNRELIIEGAVGVDMPGDMKARYAELRGGRYRRAFALSEDLDEDAISASLNAGVLSVLLPKKAAFQSRRIPIQQG